MSDTDTDHTHGIPVTHPAVISLVGAGPGDPGLITLKGVDRLSRADVVVYDRLANPALLAHCKPGAVLIDAGKGRESHHLSQEEINGILIGHARAGRRVCRLKGGDPFVFGRGGEEALALAEAGIRFEVVPGVTSAISVPASAGVPLTHRGIASSFTVITGSQDGSHHETGVDWRHAAATPGTLVVLMVWESLSDIVRNLLESGMPGDRPAALVQWGTLPRQKTVAGGLAEIPGLAASAGLAAPAVLVIGDVVRLREKIAWLDNLPLFGKRVAVTRAQAQAGRLVELLEAAGAECVEVPVIEIAPASDPAPLDAALRRLTQHTPDSGMGYGWATFASPNAVTALFDRLRTLGLDARAFAGVRFASVGPAATAALGAAGITPDIAAAEHDTRLIAAMFQASGHTGGSAVHFRSDLGRETLPAALRSLGFRVDEVVAYETVIPAGSAERARAAYSPTNSIHITTFTSSSAVNNLVQMLGEDAGPVNRTMVACIGEVTAAAARARGIRVGVVASEQSLEGLVEAVIAGVNKQ
jgi:uroporphyrinogen III methyltransferase/synthase